MKTDRQAVGQIDKRRQGQWAVETYTERRTGCDTNFLVMTEDGPVSFTILFRFQSDSNPSLLNDPFPLLCHKPPSTRLSLCPTIHPPVPLSDHPPVCPSSRLYVRPSVCLSFLQPLQTRQKVLFDDCRKR